MEKIAMHQVREILRLRWSLGRSVRQTAASVGLSRGVVSKTTTRASLTGLNWELVCVLSDGALDERVYGKPAALTGDRAEPDPVRMHLELKRPGVTLELLHIEYKEAHPDGFQYTAFCQRYRRWLKRTAPSMRQKHVAGEKTFVDYSGVRPHYIDEATGERVYVELFVAVPAERCKTAHDATLDVGREDVVATRSPLDSTGTQQTAPHHDPVHARAKRRWCGDERSCSRASQRPLRATSASACLADMPMRA